MKKEYSRQIKQEALRLGFDACGITRAVALDDEKPLLTRWLQNGMHGDMHYMENHLEKRIDPRLLVEGAKSIIVVLLNYFPEEMQTDPETPKISKYAYGKDYHLVVKDKLNRLKTYIDQHLSPSQGRPFVDSAPVMERTWAQRAGLGWIGKNSLLLNKKLGSFVFIGELIIDLELEYDSPQVHEYCGGCHKCLDACPTQAIESAGVVNASKCISYFTIEYRDNVLPQWLKGKMENWMFGCDICQDVCPWNRKTPSHKTNDFNPLAQLMAMQKQDWENLTKEQYQELFKKSAVQRTKYEGLKRNIAFLKEEKTSIP